MILPNRELAVKLVEKYRYEHTEKSVVSAELRALSDVELVGLIRYLRDLDGHSYGFCQTAFPLRDLAERVFINRKMNEVSDAN